MLSSLRTKITVFTFVTVTVALVTGMLMTGNLLFASHRDSVRKQLQVAAASLISLGISDFSELSDFGRLNDFIESALQMERVDKIVRIYSPAKKLIYTTMGTTLDWLPRELPADIGKPVFMPFEHGTRNYESLFVPYDAKNKRFYLHLVIPLPRYAQIFDDIIWRAAMLLALLLLATFVVSRMLAAKIMRPVRMIAEHLEAMNPVSIDAWRLIEEPARGEYLEPIIQGINLLTMKAQAAVSKLRDIARFIAHELRTPLTIIQGEAETILLNQHAQAADLKAAIRSSLEEVQRMSGIVDTVLKVGEEERIEKLHNPSMINLTRWLEIYRPGWERLLGRPIPIDAPPAPVIVHVDEKLLARMIDNLVRNINDHTPKGAYCRLTVDTDGKSARIRIEDDGPGMTQQMIDALKRRRGNPPMEGLGLRFCRQIADMSDIDLGFANKPRGGLVVELRLPCVQSDGRTSPVLRK